MFRSLRIPKGKTMSIGNFPIRSHWGTWYGREQSTGNYARRVSLKQMITRAELARVEYARGNNAYYVPPLVPYTCTNFAVGAWNAVGRNKVNPKLSFEPRSLAVEIKRHKGTKGSMGKPSGNLGYFADSWGISNDRSFVHSSE